MRRADALALIAYPTRLLVAFEQVGKLSRAGAPPPAAEFRACGSQGGIPPGGRSARAWMALTAIELQAKSFIERAPAFKIPIDTSP